MTKVGEAATRGHPSVEGRFRPGPSPFVRLSASVASADTPEVNTQAASEARRVLLGANGIPALGSSEELFWALATHTPVGIFVSNATGACIYVNDRWCELAGLAPEQALGDGWSAALHPDDAQRVLDGWAQAAAGGGDSIVEYRFCRPDGSISWIQGFASALRDADGQVAGWVGTCLDLTARKDAELALVEERDRFRVAFDDAPIGLALVAHDGRFLRVNRTLCELTGYDEQQLLTLSFQAITHPDDLDADLEQAKRLLAGESRTYQLEKRYLRSDGRHVSVMLSVSVVRDHAGRPLHFVAQIEDITRRKEAERELQELADHDSLTGLLNRRRFNEELDREVARTRRHGGQSAVLMIDLDGFKLINDTHGHRAGDEVLRFVAERLRSRLRATDVVSRVGGDEFGVIAIGIPDAASAHDLCRDLVAAIGTEPVPTEGKRVQVAASIGVAILGHAFSGSADEILVAADDAMYAAKRSGRNTVATP
jgi:diguanylate cyclase (GGDEF)-like protein/PAS domain S-box-containing protein